MLALTRRIGEEVAIGDPVKPTGVVRVVSIQGDRVKLAFDFPQSVAVNRSEIAASKAADARK